MKAKLNPVMKAGDTWTRRAYVSGVVAVLAGGAWIGGTVGSSPPQTVSIEIKTTPADEDPYAIRIANKLVDRMESIGIDADVVPMTTDKLLESVLVDHDFDVYVAKHPGGHDPDYLRSLLRTEYADETGWHNPFGFGDARIDEFLDAQRHESGETRATIVRKLLDRVVERSPMTVLVHPDVIYAFNTTRLAKWPSAGLRRSEDVLEIRPSDDRASRTVRLAIPDDRITRNRNPLAVTFRDRGLLMGLIYEPLVRPSPADPEGRLATDWTWNDHSEGGKLTVTLTEATWHDGEPVTAGDVEFTYRLLSDTALGTADEPIPAPRFRGRSELVTAVESIDDRTVRFTCDSSREVALRALTVPVLPRHEWEQHATTANVAKVAMFGSETEALRWDNPVPVGSGPLEFESATVGESIRFAKYRSHFTEGPAFDRLFIRTPPSTKAAVELAITGEVDAAGPIEGALASDVAGSSTTVFRATTDRSFYHLGYNVRREPLDDYRFRQAVGALLDRREVTEQIFEDFGTASATPLTGVGSSALDERTRTLSNETNVFDSDVAVERFSDAGYTVDERGRMIPME